MDNEEEMKTYREVLAKFTENLRVLNSIAVPLEQGSLFYDLFLLLAIEVTEEMKDSLVNVEEVLAVMEESRRKWHRERFSPKLRVIK